MFDDFGRAKRSLEEFKEKTKGKGAFQFKMDGSGDARNLGNVYFSRIPTVGPGTTESERVEHSTMDLLCEACQRLEKQIQAEMEKILEERIFKIAVNSQQQAEAILATARKEWKKP